MVGARLERAVLPEPGVAGDLALGGLVRPGFVALGCFEFAHGLRKRPRLNLPDSQAQSCGSSWSSRTHTDGGWLSVFLAADSLRDVHR